MWHRTLLHVLVRSLKRIWNWPFVRYKESGLPSEPQIYKYSQEFNESYDDLAKRSPMVFCHLDVHCSNIIYDSKTGQFPLCSCVCIVFLKKHKCWAIYLLCDSKTYLNFVLSRNFAESIVFVDWERCNMCPEIVDMASLLVRDPLFRGMFQIFLVIILIGYSCLLWTPCAQVPFGWHALVLLLLWVIGIIVWAIRDIIGRHYKYHSKWSQNLWQHFC